MNERVSAEVALNQLREIWKQVLDVPVETVDRDSNFFSDGGDSLAAVEFVTITNEQFGVELPLELIFEDGTCGGLVDEIMRELRKGDD